MSNDTFFKFQVVTNVGRCPFRNFGNVLPTLQMLQTKLQAMQHNMQKHCEPLIDVLLESLERRFDKELKLSGAGSDKIIAVISHPYFKLRWLTDDEQERCRELFIQACEPVLDSSEASQSQVLDDVDDFFDYAAPPLRDATVNAVEKECINYLSDTDTELKMLSKYTRIKTVLMKYNTNLPSSDPVPRRNLLSDSMSEKLLLLQRNQK